MSPSTESAWPRLKKWFEENIKPWVGAVFVAGLFHVGLRVAMKVHWIVGLIATVVLAVWLAALLVGWRRKLYLKYTWPMAGALLLLTTLFAVAVFASVSSLDYRWDPGAYEGVAGDTSEAFAEFYLWHTVDALPGLRLWSAYGNGHPQIQQHGFLAGSALLLFRASVLAILLTAVKDWFTQKGRAETAPPRGLGSV